MSLLDRCKQYNIEPRHCQNSIYEPGSSYDNYLKSFNLPIQKDPECNKKNCLIVVYKEPPRIAVNATGATSNICEKGFNMQNFSVCMPSIQTRPAPVTLPQNSLIIQTVTVTMNTKKGEESENSVETDALPKTITKSIFVTKTDEDDTEEKERTTDDEKKTKSKQKTKTITKVVTKTTDKTETDDKESAKTSECKTESKSRKSEEIKTVTVTKDSNKEESTKTVTVAPTVQPPVETKTAETSMTTTTAASVVPSVSPPISQITQSQISTSVPSINIEQIKTAIKEKEELCEFGKNENNNCKKCEDDKCSKKKKKCKGDKCSEKKKCKGGKCSEKKKDESDSEDESEDEDSESTEKEKQKKSKKEKKEKKVQKEKEKYITLLRYKTSTITNEVPITLYREMLKTVEKEKPITRFKVSTVVNTITTTITQDKFKTMTVTEKKKKPAKTESKKEEASKTEEPPEIEKVVTKFVEPPKPEATSATQTVSPTIKPEAIKTVTEQPAVTEKPNEETKTVSEDELSKNLIPFFGKLLEKISKEAIVSKESEKPCVTEPEKKTNIVTVTKLVTTTITKTIDTESDQGKKVVINTVYAKAKPGMMKCIPIMFNNSNCLVTQEGMVYKTVFKNENPA